MRRHKNFLEDTQPFSIPISQYKRFLTAVNRHTVVKKLGNLLASLYKYSPEKNSPKIYFLQHIKLVMIINLYEKKLHGYISKISGT